jgi:23S rRNA pseudouridine2605 synthase
MPEANKPGLDQDDSAMADPDKHGDQDGERIAKVIARAGLASRREAEEWIAAGRVAVNGAVIHSPALNVGGGDRISIDGKPLPARERTRLFLYHKPRGVLTSHGDPHGRPTIFQNLPKGLPRLISVGRLDFNTEGLLLLTNDGELARVLELPATGWLRRYRVRAHGSIMQPKLDELRKGVTIDGIRYGAIEATLDRVQGSNLWLTFAIREGKNREVRNVLGHLGLTVTRLIRVSFGPFQLGELREGEVEELRTRVLREQLGERVAALSGADFSAPVIARPQAEAEETQRKRERQRPAGSRTPRDQARPNEPHQARSNKRKDRKPIDRKSPSHSWRAHEPQQPGKKLQRKFRGGRRDEERQEARPAAPARPGLLTDCKGRRVLVERHGEPAPIQPSKPEERKAPRHGRRRSPDRASGPRPRHPRGK